VLFGLRAAKRTVRWNGVSCNDFTEILVNLFMYLNYGGNCRQAFEFYSAHLGGRITMLTTHGEQPDTSQVPPDWHDAVLHARIDIGGTTVFGADIPPDRFQPIRSAYLSLLLDSLRDRTVFGAPWSCLRMGFQSRPQTDSRSKKKIHLAIE